MTILLRTSLIAVCSAFLLAAQPSAAPFKTGGDLAKQCELTNNLAVIACHLYLLAVIDVLEEDAVRGYRACVPEDWAIDRLVQVVVEGMQKYPDEGQDPASTFIAHTVSEAYPCS